MKIASQHSHSRPRVEWRRLTRQTLTALLSVAMTWNGPAFPQGLSADEDATARAFADQIELSMLALEDGDRDAPRDHWDPQYVVDQIGIDPDTLYRWVQDSVVYMPYAGLLRGAEGTLMDRVGNGIDRAVLLATLLTDAGHVVRLARGRLSDDGVAQVMAALEAGRTPLVADVIGGNDSPDTTEVADAAALYGIDPQAVGAMAEANATEASGIYERLTRTNLEQTARLAEIVGPLDDAAIAADIRAGARRAMADHWWVQLQGSSGWRDLDLLARGPADAALVPAAETFALDDLPAEVEQIVILRVVTEQLKEGRLSESVILEQAVRPRDLLGRTIGFRHFPMAWPENWPQVTPDDIQIKLRAALYAQSEWMPVLVLGESVFGTAGIYDTGEVDPSPQPANPFMQMTVGMMGMIVKSTDILATGADPDALLPDDPELDALVPPRPEGELVAERLEYEIRIPGAAPRRIVRDVFDLIGPAARARGDFATFTMSRQKSLDRAQAMMGESEIQVLSSRLAPDFLTHLGALSALGNRPVLDELARDPFGRLPSNFMELFSKLDGIPAALYTLASLRFATNPYADWVYVDRPNVVAQHIVLRRAGGGDFIAQVGLDIVENGIGVDPLAADNAVGLRIGQGVADTNSEAEALRALGILLPNTAEAFAATEPAGSGWITLRPGDEAVLARLGRTEDEAARLSADLSAGRTIVLPAQLTAGLESGGWWRIDPASGETLGIGPTGHGQAMVEYALIIIIETMMAAAQCALEASLTKALDRAEKSLREGAGLLDAAGTGASAGLSQAGADLGDSHTRNRCIAAGLFVGFKTLLVSYATHAARAAATSRAAAAAAANAKATARAQSATPSRTPTIPGLGPEAGRPGRTPTIPGVAPQAGGPRGAPTLPGVAPQAGGPRGKPTIPGVGPAGTHTEAPGSTSQTAKAGDPAGTRRAPDTNESARTQRAPNADEAASTQRAPGQPPTPAERFKDAHQRATEAQNALVDHKPVDTPEGRAATDKLWRDLDQANRDRIGAYDQMPRNQRPAVIPGVPEPKLGSGSGPAGGIVAAGGDPGAMGTAKTQPAPAIPPGGPDALAPPQNASPPPTTDELLAGLGPRGDLSTGRLPATTTNPSADDLLSGLGRGGPPPLPIRAAPKSAASAPNEAVAVRQSGLTGLLVSLEPIRDN